MSSSTRRRRPVFALLALLLAGLVVELGSAFLWRLAEGEWPTAELRAGLRTSVRAGGGEVEERLPTDGPREDVSVDIRGEREVLHPYLGYVFNPELNEREDRAARGELEIGPLGFFEAPADRGREVEPELEIGVFGGSAALLFATQEGPRQRLIRNAARATGVAPERIAVRSWALGGYKQPQQLLTLAWLLVQDRAPDVVVEIDGFNEIVLPRSDNAPHGVSLLYPRAWHQRVGTFASPAERRTIARIADLEERRSRAAELAGGAPWRWSWTASLWWRIRDRGLVAELSEARERLGSWDRGDLGYRETGAFEERTSGQAVEELVRAWADSSRQMARLARANGLVYVHALQPSQYVPGSKPLSDEERQTAWREDHPYRRLVLEGYPALRHAGEKLREEGIAFLDLTDHFRGEERSLYIDDCCHVSPLGNDLLARPIAAAVARGLQSPVRRGRNGTAD